MINYVPQINDLAFRGSRLDWLDRNGRNGDFHFAQPTPGFDVALLHRFRDWPSAAVSTSGSAVYTIWDDQGRFIYAGMSGRTADAKGRGPWGRLNPHASGRRSGDQFCIYVCDQVVFSALHNRLHEIADGSLSLDRATREFMRERLAFRFVAVPVFQTPLISSGPF